MKEFIIGGGHYSLREPLGSGGMAEVFLAHDEILERDVLYGDGVRVRWYSQGPHPQRRAAATAEGGRGRVPDRPSVGVRPRAWGDPSGREAPQRPLERGR